MSLKVSSRGYMSCSFKLRAYVSNAILMSFPWISSLSSQKMPLLMTVLWNQKDIARGGLDQEGPAVSLMAPVIFLLTGQQKLSSTGGIVAMSYYNWLYANSPVIGSNKCRENGLESFDPDTYVFLRELDKRLIMEWIPEDCCLSLECCVKCSVVLTVQQRRAYFEWNTASAAIVRVAANSAFLKRVI